MQIIDHREMKVKFMLKEEHVLRLLGRAPEGVNYLPSKGDVIILKRGGRTYICEKVEIDYYTHTVAVILV